MRINTRAIGYALVPTEHAKKGKQFKYAEQPNNRAHRRRVMKDFTVQTVTRSSQAARVSAISLVGCAMVGLWVLIKRACS